MNYDVILIHNFFKTSFSIHFCTVAYMKLVNKGRLHLRLLTMCLLIAKTLVKPDIRGHLVHIRCYRRFPATFLFFAITLRCNGIVPNPPPSKICLNALTLHLSIPCNVCDNTINIIALSMKEAYTAACNICYIY